MRLIQAGRQTFGRRGAHTAVAVLLVAATCVVGATAAGQAWPTFKKVGGWGKVGTANGQFGGNAFGLAVDKSGNVYVADSDNHRIQVFSASGGFLRKMAFPPSESVTDVAIDIDGSVWGTSNQGTKAQQFSKSGGALEAITTPKLGLGVAVDQQGNVLVATAGDNIASVIRYDKASGYAAGKTLGGFKSPHDVEVSPDGSVYVSDNGSLTVKRFDANGRLLKTIKGGPAAPLGVAVDLDCNVWVTNISQRRVDRYSPTGKLLGSATAGDLIAQDVAVGPKGDLYAFDSGTRSVVRLAEDTSKPATATVGGVTVVKKGARSVARVKYTAAGIACPAQLNATVSLSGGGSGHASVKVAAGKSTVIEIPLAKAPSSGASATFKIVLKTNGRPTTQTASVRLG